MGHAPEATTTLPRVLVVDDDPLVRRPIVRALRNVATTTEAGSVREATALLQEHEMFAGVVCDVNLGDGLGWEILACVRARSNDTKVTMISGDARNVPHAEQLGVLLVGKPFDASDIVRSIGLTPSVSRSTIPPAGNNDGGSPT